MLEATRENGQDTIMGNDFLNRLSGTQEMTVRPKKWGFINSISKLYPAKETTGRRDNVGSRQNLCCSSGEVNSHSVRI